MQTALLGRKIGMTQIYDADGTLHPTTVVQAGPCQVLQVKTPETDGYHALQIGFEDVKIHRARKPQIGHAKRAGAAPKRMVREIRLDAPADSVERGQVLTVEVFEGVAYVDVMGTVKGKGFTGVMKRYGFKGQLASHGVERKHRSAGSIASHASNAGTGPKIAKGKRMAGHSGNVRRTTRNHKLLGIDKENNLLLIRGAIPGADGGCVFVRRSKTAKKAE